jgi:hypothetical protein
MDVATLAELLRETAEHHDHYEKTHAEHHGWDWYAPYLSARQRGSSPAEAVTAANRYMEEVLHVLPDDFDAQRNAFHRRNVRLQSRSFARWNQSLRHSPNSNRLC